MTMTYRILQVMKDGLPRSSEEISQKVKENWGRTRKTVVNLCCEDFAVAMPVRYSLASDGFRRLGVTPRNRDKGCLTHRILQSLADGGSKTVHGLAEDLGEELESVRMLMTSLLYRKALKSVPVTYQITDKGKLRASRPPLRRLDKPEPMPPNKQLVSTAIAAQPTLMRVWGMGA